MTTHICLVVGVLEILGINEMIEAWKTFEIRIIWDAAKPLAQPMRYVVDDMVGFFP